ncbi:MAG TPA: Rha family transcriptional regulator [Patescibacteria group bacterium]
MGIQNIVRVETQNNKVIDFLQVGTEYRIDSRIVAKGLDLEHLPFRRLLEKYQFQLEHFGKVDFQNQANGITDVESQLFENQQRGRGRPEMYVLLNRDQVLFAITLSRNTEEVIEWKMALIDALSQLEKQVRTLRTFGKQKQIESSDMFEDKVLRVVVRRTGDTREWITPAVVRAFLNDKYSVGSIDEVLKSQVGVHLEYRPSHRVNSKGWYRLSDREV